MANKLGFNLPDGYIIIMKPAFAARQRTTTLLGRAFVLTVDERSTGAFQEKEGNILFGYWLSDPKKAESRITEDMISVRETKQFYTKFLPKIIQNLAIEFHSFLLSALTKWVVEDDCGEQMKFLAKVRSATPLLTAYNAVQPKTEETVTAS